MNSDTDTTGGTVSRTLTSEGLLLSISILLLIASALLLGFGLLIDGFLGYPFFFSAVCLSAAGCFWLFSRLARA